MNIALLGLGFMGATHAKAWGGIPGARLAAVMSSDERKLSGDLTGIEGNLGNQGERLDFGSAARYRTVDEVLRDPNVEALDICLPTDMHAPVAKAALEAGKHVLVEKPISLDTAEAEALIELSKTNERVFMAGQVLRFIPAYSKLREELAASGPVRSAFFRRRCAAPAWSNWLADPKKSGGGVFDLLIHDADYCIGLWGVPKSVRATGYEDLAAGVDWINAELTYPDMGPVVITGGWHHPKTYPFSMEFTVISAGATYEWPFGAPTLKKYAANGEASDVQLPETDAFAAELQYFTDCVNEGRRPEFCPPEQSAAAVRLMLDMLESRKQNGEKILCR